MRKFTFESTANEDRVVVSFRENSLQETIDKFFGLLRASGYNEELVKSSAKDVIDGKWINNLSGLLTINPISLNINCNTFSTSQLSSLSTNTITPLSIMNDFK